MKRRENDISGTERAGETEILRPVKGADNVR